MWYRKNVGGWERAARLIGGGLMLICGVVALHASPLGLLLGGAGVVTLVTGVFGYCPACAIAGREPVKGWLPWRAYQTISCSPHSRATGTR
jgi:hypothetical protein